MKKLSTKSARYSRESSAQPTRREQFDDQDAVDEEVNNAMADGARKRQRSNARAEGGAHDDEGNPIGFRQQRSGEQTVGNAGEPGFVAAVARLI